MGKKTAKEFKAEDFDIMVSHPSLKKEPGWYKYIEGFAFLQITGDLKPVKDDLTVPDPDQYIGTPLDTTEEAEEEAEATSEDDPDDKVSENKEAFRLWNQTLHDIFLKIRKETGSRISFVRKGSGGLVTLVMIEQANIKEAKVIFDAVSKKSGIAYHIREVNPNIPGTDIDKTDLMNLLMIRMLYIHADNTGIPVPSDVILPGYAVYNTGDIVTHAGKSNEELTSAAKAKNSFLSIYAYPDKVYGCSLLGSPLKPYFENGEWINTIKSEKKKNNVIGKMRYDVFSVDNGMFVLTEGEKGRLTPYSAFKKTGKSKMNVLSTSTSDILFHDKTKRYQIFKMQSMFNQIYKGVASLQFETWNCQDTDLGALTRDTDRQNELSQAKIDKINLMRDIIGSKGLHVSLDSGDQDKEAVFTDALNECVSYAIYQTGTYKRELKNTDDFFIDISALDQSADEDYLIQVGYAEIEYSYKLDTDAEEQKTTPSSSDPKGEKKGKKKRKKNPSGTLRGTRKAGEERVSFNFAGLPEVFTIKKISIGVSAEMDIPLSDAYTLNICLNGKSNPQNLSYHTGLGLSEGSLIETGHGFSKNRLNIHMIQDNDKKLQQYISTRCLSVQHISANDVSSRRKKNFNDSLAEKCQRILFELYIRNSLIDEEIPEEDDLDEALYVAHVPRKGNQKAYKRFFLYKRVEQQIKEIGQDAALEYFPSLQNLDRYGDQYAIRIGGDRYYIKNSGLVPLGKPFFDEEGNLLPLAETASKSMKKLTYLGYVGITTYSHTDDKCLYYMPGSSVLIGDIKKTIDRFVNIYRVTADSDEYGVPKMPDADAFKNTLANTMIRITGYTVIPSIFKYLREWAKTGGKVHPAI